MTLRPWFAAVLCVMAMLVASSAHAREPVGPTPLGNPGDWVTTPDYPSSELRRGVQGTTAFSLTVDNDGMPLDCVVTESSGSDILDATACALVKTRARFAPGRDSKGKKVDGLYSNRVRWMLPGVVGIPMPDKYDMTTTVELDEKGIISRCEVGGPSSTAPPANAQTPCSRYPVNTKMRPYLDWGGNPMKVRVIMRETVEVVPAIVRP